MSIYCNKCPFLFPTEGEQTKEKEPHMCLLLNKSVKHEGLHPNIVKHKDCKKDQVIEKYDEQLMKMVARWRKDGLDDSDILNGIITLFELPPGFPSEECI